MKPIAIHLDRLAKALSDKGVELKRTDLLQVAAAAFGYHNQNEASAASQRGDLTPPAALPICRVPVPSSPDDRTVVILQDGTTGMAYGIDAEFFDAQASGARAERYGPTPFGQLADLGYAMERPESDWSVGHKDPTAAVAHLDAAVREANLLERILGDITGADDGQAEQLGQAENAMSRLKHALRGGAEHTRERRYDTDWRVIRGEVATDAEKASWARDVEGMDAAVKALFQRHAELALLTPETAAWSRDCLLALQAGLRIARDWESSHDQEVRFGPDWKAWEKELKKAATRGADPLSDMDLHKIRHAVADNHCKSSESERSTVRWREGRLMERHGRALLLRLDMAEAQIAADDRPSQTSAYVPIGSMWKLEMRYGMKSKRHVRLFRVASNEDGHAVGAAIAQEVAGRTRVHELEITVAPEVEAELRLVDAARRAAACLADDSKTRTTLLKAIRAVERELPKVHGHPEPQAAPPEPGPTPAER